MITGGNPKAEVSTGFGFLTHVVIDQHFLKRKREERLMGVLASHPGLAGIGIDEETAVIVRGRSIFVLGNSVAVACLPASARKPASQQVLKPGVPGGFPADKVPAFARSNPALPQADLIALCRTAIARVSPQFPAEKPPAPNVPNGSLLIGGGGALADAIYLKFIELAGGPDAPIVVIPTSMDDPVPKDPGEAKRLKKLGAKNVVVLHTRSRAEADTAQFCEPLQGAKGVWFCGGRQWRFVDAYEGTKAFALFHDVLKRGGVIGGSSAGASIQSDYMPRGDPLGNLNIIAEGYERGFGFVQGVAIDQHFLKRKRPADMTGLMKVYPQLLGLGIDEGTALLVRGEVMEVLGVSTVAVYDRTRPVKEGEPDYQALPAGSRYNLRTRQVLAK
jgi:cyanophycinase